jgi:hypothetical protein
MIHELIQWPFSVTRSDARRSARWPPGGLKVLSSEWTLRCVPVGLLPVFSVQMRFACDSSMYASDTTSSLTGRGLLFVFPAVSGASEVRSRAGKSAAPFVGFPRSAAKRSSAVSRVFSVFSAKRGNIPVTKAPVGAGKASLPCPLLSEATQAL